MLKEIISNHVIPTYDRKGWAVRKSNARRASRVFGTQEEAIAYGTMVSNAHKIPLYIHKTNGMVANKIVFKVSKGK
jgi:hypothetical protein